VPVRNGVGTSDPAAIATAINAQSGTRAYFGITMTQVTVAGAAGSTNVLAFAGDASWGGYQLISGSIEVLNPTAKVTAVAPNAIAATIAAALAGRRRGGPGRG
jgi:hypothetical protein